MRTKQVSLPASSLGSQAERSWQAPPALVIHSSGTSPQLGGHCKRSTLIEPISPLTGVVDGAVTRATTGP